MAKNAKFDFIIEKLRTLNENATSRNLYSTDRILPYIINKGNKKLISFSCNDYLGLSHNQEIKQKLALEINQYPLGAGGSRFISGNSNLYKLAEAKISQLKFTENTLIFGSGYLTNLGVIPAFVDRKDLVVADKLVHASIIDAVKLSGAKLVRFEHNDINHAETLLKKQRKFFNKCLLITETVFSMDGDQGDIAALLDLATIYNSFVLSDDAHGFGIFTQDKSLVQDQHLQVGTLSKAIGCYGGYLAANNMIIEYTKNIARPLIFSTALPPMILLSILSALEIIEQDIKDGRNLCNLPMQKARLFTNRLGIQPAKSPIVPVIIGDSQKTLDIAKILEEKGFYVKAIRPPTVPKNTSRLRIAFSASHQDHDIEQLADLLARLI